MKTKLASIASALVLAGAIALSGAAPAQAACNTGNPGAREVFGTIAGAVIGGLIGSRIGSGAGRGVAIGAGVFLGGVLGNRIGNALDCEDQRRHQQATYQALEGGQDNTTSAWRNPNTGASGQTTPTETFYENGKPCRRFTTSVTTGDGQTKSGEGKACRNSSGGWDIT